MNKPEVYDGLPMPRRIYSVIAITLGLFSSIMNSTIANVALPTIGANLDISAADSIWIINVYQIATIVFLLPCSSIGEMTSYKRMLLSGLSLFTLASFCCAFSASFAMLICFRILQGLGSAAMVSVNMTLVRLTYPKHLLGLGIGLNSTFVAISSVAGPAIASTVISFMSWPWLFALNVPIGILAVLFGAWALPANPIKVAHRPFPVLDAVLNGVFFCSVILFMEGFTHDFSSWLIALLGLVAIVSGVVYIPRQILQDVPLLPFDLLRIPVFSVSILASIASFIAQMTAMTALPFFLQHQMEYTASEAGFIFTAWPCVIMVTAPLSGVLMRRFHPAVLGGVGQVLIIIGLISLALVNNSSSESDIILRMMLVGSGFGLFQSPNNSVIMQSAPPRRNGSASGMLATSRLLGQTTGAMMVALMFNIYGDAGSRFALWTAAAVATLACILSISRRGMNAEW